MKLLQPEQVTESKLAVYTGALHPKELFYIGYLHSDSYQRWFLHD